MAVYVINRLPTPLLNNLSPFFKLFSKSLYYSFMRVFGYQCFPNLTPYTKHKFQPRSVRCVFVEYASHYKAYRCLDLLTGRIYIHKHVVFHEHKFPYRELPSMHQQPDPPPIYFPSWTATVSHIPSLTNPNSLPGLFFTPFALHQA